MASLVTGRVPGAGKVSPEFLPSKSQDFFFFNPKPSFSQQLFPGAGSRVSPGLGQGLELRDSSYRSCHVAMDFPL